ncbi:MAG: prolyl oligopeptidase family serine peptidase [Ignavibacteria bacterium]|nr:prolyl oligopeptidase family serine peptidase [Ignavibacteria bacterium]
MKINLVKAIPKICLIFLFFVIRFSYSQEKDTITSKLILDHSVYEKWNKLEKPNIDFSGNYVSYEINPQKGDGFLVNINLKTNKIDTFYRGYDLTYSANSDFIVFKLKPPYELTRKLKLEKKKKEEFPTDTLCIKKLRKFRINEYIDTIIKIPDFKEFSIPENMNSKPVIVYLTETKEKPQEEKLKKKKTKETEELKVKDTYTLNIYDLSKDTLILNINNISDFSLSKNGNNIGYVKLSYDTVDNKSINSEVYIFNYSDLSNQKIFTGKGNVMNITLDSSGIQSAFLFTKDTSEVKRYSLYYWKKDIKLEKLSLNIAKKIADTNSYFLPPDWEISGYKEPKFTDNGKRLIFGIAPKIFQQPKDTLLEEEKFKLDIWSTDDDRLQSQQLKELDKDKKKTYDALYNIDENSLVFVADSTIQEIKYTKNLNSNYAIGLSYSPYYKLVSWEDPAYKDVYLINLNTGVKSLIIRKQQYEVDISPTGNYIIYWNKLDSSWYTYSISNSTFTKLSFPEGINLSDELNDTPGPPEPYGICGWTLNDENVLIYDRYDIWKVDPKNINSAINITNGRNTKSIFRYINLDKDSIYIPTTSNILLYYKNEDNFKEGFYKVNLNDNKSPYKLIETDNNYTKPIKARNAELIIWQKASYLEYPDLWVSDLDFLNLKKLSYTNPQQQRYLWGTVELVKWLDSTGTEQKGLLYKPENLDSTKKYPMIVYFYEKYTDKIHTHYIPNPSRSVINFPLYNSNGYIIFIPDLTYKIGYPGESAFNIVMSGTLAMLERGYIDRNNLGLQGQSWGGYQVAYIVTRTDLFKAAMSGAPVVNMTSAYGGIRWESGLVRIFQYEQAQSRIGATLWERLDLYLENSPLFKVDKIVTPLLIMSNDNDGAVPWQQGLEFYNALRRLNKKAWLLSYNGEEHNLTKWPNRVDLSIRMKQFFDHYLKGMEMPEWMAKGIPAIKKGLIDGY